MSFKNNKCQDFLIFRAIIEETKNFTTEKSIIEREPTLQNSGVWTIVSLFLCKNVHETMSSHIPIFITRKSINFEPVTGNEMHR